MARLVIRSGKEKGKTLEVTASAIIGRGDTADVRISDAKASREHCRVFEQLGRWVVTDLNSRNGITVNGVKKTRANLSDGDKIAIGQTVLVFDGGGAAAGGGGSASAGKKGGSAKDKAFAAARSAPAPRQSAPKAAASSSADAGGDKGMSVSKSVLQFSHIDEKKAKPWDRDLSQSTVLMQMVYWAVGIGLVVLLFWGGIKMMG